MLEYLARYYQVSNREVKDYLEILSKEEVSDILKKYGVDKKVNQEMAEIIRDKKNKVKYSERVEKNTQEENAIDYCERLYPETTKEFKQILDEMYVTFCKKQRNYGPR